MNGQFSWTDGDDGPTQITVRPPAVGPPGCMLEVNHHPSGHIGVARIGAADVPAVAKGISDAMHEAVGLPVPIVLECLRGASTGSRWRGRLGDIGVTQDGTARVEVWTAGPGRFVKLEPAEAREHAAALAAWADVAANMAVSTDVRALAEVIRSANESAGIPSEIVARAILARYTLTERAQ